MERGTHPPSRRVVCTGPPRVWSGYSGGSEKYLARFLALLSRERQLLVVVCRRARSTAAVDHVLSAQGVKEIFSSLLMRTASMALPLLVALLAATCAGEKMGQKLGLRVGGSPGVARAADRQRRALQNQGPPGGGGGAPPADEAPEANADQVGFLRQLEDEMLTPFLAGRLTQAALHGELLTLSSLESPSEWLAAQMSGLHAWSSDLPVQGIYIGTPSGMFASAASREQYSEEMLAEWCDQNGGICLGADSLIRSVCNGGDDQPRQFSAVDELGGTFHWVGPTCKKKHHCMRMVPSRVLVNSLSLSDILFLDLQTIREYGRGSPLLSRVMTAQPRSAA